MRKKVTDEPKNKHYTLTLTAEKDFRQAKHWSLSRRGKTQTKEYFANLHQSAEYIALNQKAVVTKEYLSADTGLGIYAAGKHHIVYLPTQKNHIVIVALIRQACDVTEILRTHHYRIQREVKDIHNK